MRGIGSNNIFKDGTSSTTYGIVIIDGTGGILPKHGLIFGSSHNIRIRVLDPVLPSSFNDDTPEELAIKLRLLMKSELKNLRKNINVQ